MKLDDLMALVDRHVMSDVTSDLHSESRRERVESRYVNWLETKCDELERSISAYSAQATQSEKLVGLIEQSASLKAELDEVRARPLPIDHGERIAVVEKRFEALTEELKAQNPDERLAEIERQNAEAIEELRARPVQTPVDDAPLRAVADRVTALERAPAPVVEFPVTEPLPSEYDIDVVRGADDRMRAINISALGMSFDVVRGGDDRIRTLRVKVVQ
jgi:hypothetical protein